MRKKEKKKKRDGEGKGKPENPRADAQRSCGRGIRRTTGHMPKEKNGKDDPVYLAKNKAAGEE